MKPIHFVLLLFAIALSVSRTDAQWVQTNGPYGGFVNELCVSGTRLFAGGTEGSGVFVSSDSGRSWTSVNSGLTNRNVYGLAANPSGIGEPYIFACTGDGIFRSSDSGMNWSEINSGMPGTGVSYLTTSPNGEGGTDLFVGIGSGGLEGSSNIYWSTDNGTTWVQINADSMSRFIVDLTVIGTDLFVAASWGGGLFRLTNNGTSWTLDTLLMNVSVYCLDVSGDSLFAGTSDGVSLFAKNDTSWTAVSSGLNGKTVRSLAVSGTKLFAGTWEPGVFYSSNSGKDWTQTSLGLNANGYPYALDLAFLGTSICAGTWDGIFLSTDNGISWTPANTGIPCTYVYAFGDVPTGTAQSHLLVSTGATFFTTDNGIEWTSINTFAEYGVFCFFVVPNGMGGINVFAGGNGVFVSTDNGISWALKGLTNARVFAFAVIGSHLFAGTEASGVYVSTNSGTDWTAANSGITNLNVMSLATSDTILFAGTGGGVFLSTNYGASWTAVNNGLPEEIYMRDLAVSGSGVFVGLASGAYLSTNNGSSWTEVNSGLTNHDVYAFAVAPDKASVFAGTYGGGVFLFTDSGTSWTAVNSGLPQNTYVTQLAISGNNLFAGTRGSGVWRRPLSEMITSLGPVISELPRAFLLHQNYPNPFNPSTTIRYGLPIRSYVVLTVFNTLGQQVAAVVKGEMEVGYHEAVFDAGNLASGVYLYRLQAGGFVQTRKFVLLR